MKLQRRFDWEDRESIYQKVNEEDVERGTDGKVRFVAVRLDGTKFGSQAYESTVASMVDTPSGFWKLAPNPKKPEKSLVVPADPNLAQSETTTEKASLGGKYRTSKTKGD